MLDTKKFIEKARKVHGDRYDYSKVNYTGSRDSIDIICPIHGLFTQLSYNHLTGRGCPKCAGKFKTNNEVIEDFKKIHGDKYDYSLVNYKDSKTLIKIICKNHGIFKQIPQSHLKGRGCPKCAGKFKTNNEIIEDFKNIHGDKYDYSLVDYKGIKTPIEIICKKHGIFEQTPNNHLKGNGCPKCTGRKRTTEEFINLAKKIHGDKYDYSLVNYIGSEPLVKIICKKHGIFQQMPNRHLQGKGCPVCKESKGEALILNILKELNIYFIRQKIFKDLKHKGLLKFDFYLPDFNCCIEYDGEQHFKPISIWGGEENLKDIQYKDRLKSQYCNDNNISLLRINYKNKDVKNKILDFLNIKESFITKFSDFKFLLKS